jgi:hypothetical protein
MSILTNAHTLGNVISGHAAERPDKVAFETLDGHARRSIKVLKLQHEAPLCSNPPNLSEAR